MTFIKHYLARVPVLVWLCVGLFVFLTIQTFRLREAHEDIEMMELAAKAAKAENEAVVAVLNQQAAGESKRTTEAIEQALADRPAATRTVVRTVKEAVANDPSFAACVRPAELHALRVQQLADVDKAGAD